jgi:hypothetical protein
MLSPTHSDWLRDDPIGKKFGDEFGRTLDMDRHDAYLVKVAANSSSECGGELVKSEKARLFQQAGLSCLWHVRVPSGSFGTALIGAG